MTMDDSDGAIDWDKFETGGRGRRGLRAVGENETADEVENSDPLRMKMEGYSGVYSPQKFYIKSSDGKGHQYNMQQINLPANFAAVIAKLKEDHPTEYRNNADIVRDAVMHLVALRDFQQGLELSETWVLEASRSDVEQAKRLMEARKAEVDEFNGAMRMASDHRDYEMLDSLVERLEERLTKVESKDQGGPYYKELGGLYKQYSGEMKRVRESGEYKDS